MCKDDAINIMNGSNLVNKKRMFHKICLLCIKMSRCNSVDSTYYQRNRNVIVNRAKDYYHKERLRKLARDKYRDLFEEEKIKRENMEKNRYRNMPEEKNKE